MPTFRNWRSQQLQRLRNDSDRMFERLCSDFGLPPVCRPLMEPSLVMKDTPDTIVLEADLPSAQADDLEVYVEGMSLVVRCVHAEACEESGAEGSSMYESRFRLPCKVRTEEVEAEFVDHRLRIVMPKCRRPETRQIPIKTTESR